MTYPPRAPRVGRMDSGYSPQQWGRKIKRLKVGKKKGRSSFRDGPPSCQPRKKKPKGHNEGTTCRGEFYSGRTSLLKTREATYVIISCPLSFPKLSCSAEQPLSSQHQSRPTVPNWKHLEDSRLVEPKLGWESIPIRGLSLSTKSTLRSSEPST